jgi:hypothetical protein
LDLLHDLGESLAANALAFQDLVKRVMAYARFAFKFAHSDPKSVISDVFALSGHLKSGHAWSVQNRPCTKAVRDEIVLPCRRLSCGVSEIPAGS